MTVSTIRRTVLFLSASLFFSSATASCYFPNGTDQNVGTQAKAGITYKPCNPNGEHSMCCAPWDTCTPDGLCKSGYDGNIWRDSCTDPTWQSPSCVKLCVSGFSEAVIEAQTSLNMANNDVTVTRCPADGSYCCGNGTAAQECCSNHLGVWIIPGTGQTTNKNPNPNGGVPSYTGTTTPATLSWGVGVTSTKAGTAPATVLSSYAWSSPSSIGVVPLTTLLVGGNVSNSTANSTATSTGKSLPSIPAVNTSLPTFNGTSSATIAFGRLSHTKPAAGFVLVAGLFFLAT